MFLSAMRLVMSLPEKEFKMRLAYVCADRGIPVFGQKGCSIHVQEMIRSFFNKGLDVELIASHFDGQAPDDLSKVNVQAIFRVGKQIEERFPIQVDFLNRQTEKTLDLLGPFDCIYERYSLWSTGAMSFAKKNGIPGVLEVNAPLIEEEQTHRGLVYEDIARECERKAFCDASLIIGVSDEVCDYVRTKTDGNDRRMIKTIPNGINPKRFSQMPQLKSQFHDSDFLTVGFVGSLKPWHGIETLINAFGVLRKIYGHLRLLIVGDGPEKAQIVDKISRMGLRESVELTGAVPPDQIPKYLGRMDIAVAPYPQMDHFYFSPLKVYEYMAAGLPVVASEIGQLKGLIGPDNNGVFFEPGNSSSLVQSLIRLIEDPDLCRLMGQNAQQEMFSRYTWDHVAEEIIQSVAKIKTNGVLAC
jgi:glycosyltransferase involved in cell wall biosynthesis